MMNVMESNQKEGTDRPIEISRVQINQEDYFKISNVDEMLPFFMSIVSDSNHWMFIASNGGLTAGRKNAEYALFPYYTSDKVTESSELTGSKSIFLVDKGEKSQIWEPFSERYAGRYKITRNLYKHIYGNKIIFEEINHDLALTFQYQWCSSNEFGFVRQSSLINNATEEVKIELLDGIQNIVPAGVESAQQNAISNLVDAYKRNELEKETGLGIYALSAIIVDKAEPSEALKANIVWSLGFDQPKYLVSSLQLENFRKRNAVHEEVDIKAEKGAYFIHTTLLLPGKAEKEWMIIANVNQNHAGVTRISDTIRKGKKVANLIKADIDKGTQQLIELNAAADGFQLTADKFRDTRHFANALFNIMRGGIFDNNYEIEKWDFSDYLAKANKKVFITHSKVLSKLPNQFTLVELKTIASKSENSDFKRLCFEYMPLKFSRRHGDPSRPWNKFSINTRSEVDGSKILDYQGNWRDIFQNWEALAHSYPSFIESMIHKFLNASTFDGYNPYRVTKDGFDWEIIEPDDPWSYIGYWGDHQIIYLLKFLEFIEKHQPGSLVSYFEKDLFVYANVPYKIKEYAAILKNPKDTIDFDHAADEKIRQFRSKLGADGALLQTQKGDIHKVNFIEKILASLLAKLSNLIPEGGIWMNTQRPEWNDANNALVGNGVSMVTLYYIRRFLNFFEGIFEDTSLKKVKVSIELANYFKQIITVFETHQQLLNRAINDKNRKVIVDALGQAANKYRQGIYKKSFSGKKKNISLKKLRHFINISLRYTDHSIKANKRNDELYHAYNIMTVENDQAISIGYLSEMLEGQVAILSAGYLSSQEALQVLDGLKNSQLFREDQYSYILYPNKKLPGFIAKNRIAAAQVDKSNLLKKLIANGNTQIIEKDVKGHFHFNGNFKNANDLNKALANLETTVHAKATKKDKKIIGQIFEEVFNHKAFTGRSGTFFGYEGLGSIYWHMVSKLLLAVQECCLKAIEDREPEVVIGRLLEHYYEINAGIGVHKSPQLYGAFPTDPYSHTPAGRGAQQPGMTGQVKEDILSRFGELGVIIRNGQIHFYPCLLRKEEFLTEASIFNYINLQGKARQLKLKKKTLCFTYCQVPIIYQISKNIGLIITNKKGKKTKLPTASLDKTTSQQIFARTGEVTQIIVNIQESLLK